MMVTRTADITILAADPAVWGVKIVISAVLVTIIIDSSDITHHFIVKHHPNDQNKLYRTVIGNYIVDISYIRVLTPDESAAACGHFFRGNGHCSARSRPIRVIKSLFCSKSKMFVSVVHLFRLDTTI